MSPEESQEAVEPISDPGYLEQLLADGYTVRGPRQDPSRDLVSFRAFLRSGHEFAPENWLVRNGYQFVEPSTFTKGFRLLYKLIDGFPDQRFRSNYSLVKGDSEIPLYLRSETKTEGE